MKSKVSLRTFLGSAFFLFFFSVAIPVLAQSTGDVSSPQSQQSASTAEIKPTESEDDAKAIQTKDVTLEGEKVWVDTGISLEPGQRIVVSSEGTLRYRD